MAGLTKKHFKEIADIINKNAFTPNKVIRLHAEHGFLLELVNYFKTQNPLFSKERFLKACLE